MISGLRRVWKGGMMSGLRRVWKGGMMSGLRSKWNGGDISSCNVMSRQQLRKSMKILRYCSQSAIGDLNLRRSYSHVSCRCGRLVKKRTLYDADEVPLGVKVYPCLHFPGFVQSRKKALPLIIGMYWNQLNASNYYISRRMCVT